MKKKKKQVTNTFLRLKLSTMKPLNGIGFYGLSNNLAMAVAPSAGIWVYGATGDFTLLFWISLGVALLGFWCSTAIRLPYRKPVEGKPHLSMDHFFLTRAWLNGAYHSPLQGVLGEFPLSQPLDTVEPGDEKAGRQA